MESSFIFLLFPAEDGLFLEKKDDKSGAFHLIQKKSYVKCFKSRIYSDSSDWL